MNRAPNTRLQLTGAAQLLQFGRRWRSAVGGLRRPQLKRNPLGGGGQDSGPGSWRIAALGLLSNSGRCMNISRLVSPAPPASGRLSRLSRRRARRMVEAWQKAAEHESRA
jgi:hypothetical protein